MEKTSKQRERCGSLHKVIDLWNSLPEATGHRSLCELRGRLEMCYRLETNKLKWKKSNAGKSTNGEYHICLLSSPEICISTHLENTGALGQLVRARESILHILVLYFGVHEVIEVLYPSLASSFSLGPVPCHAQLGLPIWIQCLYPLKGFLKSIEIVTYLASYFNLRS